MYFLFQQKPHLQGHLDTNNSNKPEQIMNKAEVVQIHPHRTSPDLHQFLDHIQESLQQKEKKQAGMLCIDSTLRNMYCM